MSAANEFENVSSNIGAPVELSVNVSGIQVSFNKRNGVLLRDAKFDKDASEGSYYEISIQTDGSNPDYPHRDRPFLYKFTQLTEENMFGAWGSIIGIQKGQTLSKIIVGEEVVDDVADRQKPGYMGPIKMPRPIHHQLSLSVETIDSSGKVHKGPMIGLITRLSDQTEQYLSAVRSPSVGMAC